MDSVSFWATRRASTSVALPKAIGAPVGTATLQDFEQTDCILIFGQNTSTNSPRMLHQLDDAAKRGLKIAFENWFETNLQHLDHFKAVTEVLPQPNVGFNFGVDFVGGTPEEFARHIRTEHARIGKMLKDGRLKMEQ